MAETVRVEEVGESVVFGEDLPKVESAGSGVGPPGFTFQCGHFLAVGT